MTHRSPLVTLAGLVVAFGLMFGVNLASSAPPSAASAPSVSVASATESAVAETPSPSATPTRSATESDESEFRGRVVYAGRTRDGSAAIAIAVLGNRAAAYLCDGRNVEAWLRGTVDEDEITLRGRGGARLEAELRGDRLRGEITIDGREHAFRVNEAKKPAGLYRAKGSATTIGWIVLPDGSQVGIETAGGRSTPAPKLDPEQPQVQVGGETLEASPVEGEEEI